MNNNWSISSGKNTMAHFNILFNAMQGPKVAGNSKFEEGFIPYFCFSCDLRKVKIKQN